LARKERHQEITRERNQHLKKLRFTLEAKAGTIVKILLSFFLRAFQMHDANCQSRDQGLDKAAKLFSLLIVKCIRKDTGVGKVAKNITHYRM
jgi:hypothetical protein